MVRLLCVLISLFLFILQETKQGISRENTASKAKEQEQVTMFHIEISGTITKYYVKTESRVYKFPDYKNAGKLTKLTLSKDGKFMTKKHVDWFGGTFRLEVDIPESEKKGNYELVASSPLYDDKSFKFTVRDSDKSPHELECNATITSSGMYEKHHDGQKVWHPNGAYNWTYL